MPSGKPSEKTWSADELGQALKEPREERRKHREKDEKRRPREEDGEKRRRRKEDEDGRKKRDHEGGEKKHRSSRHHDDEDEKKSRRRRDDGEAEERHRRHKDRDEDRERRLKERDEDDRKHRSERKHREKDPDREEKRRHRKDETEEERKIRKQREREERKKGEDGKRHRRDETEEERRERKLKEREIRKQEEEEEEAKKKEEKRERRRKEKEEKRRQEEMELAKNKPKEDDYDDDFEDYEDDFEDADDDVPQQRKPDYDYYAPEFPEGDAWFQSLDTQKFNDEMEEIMQAMNDENERLVKESQKGGNWSDSTESEDMRSQKGKRPTTASQRTFINFVSAKQRQISSKAASKTRQRGNELAQLIELDSVEFDMFDLQPIGEYELYIRNFGSSNTKQAYIQTNDDNLEREIQTEEILSEEKWTQHPPEDIFSSGGDKEQTEDPELNVVDSIRLGKFLEKAGQVIAVLLEENFAETHKSDANQQQSQICVSEAYNELIAPPYLEGRHVVQSHFSSTQNQALITIHSAKEGGEMNDPLARKGIVCVWNVNEPSQPQSLLACESQPTCGCLSPNKVSMAFAGMRDGSLVCWDLREANSMHRPVKVKDIEVTPRYPSYNTAGVLHYDNHQSSLVAVVTVTSGDGSASTGSEGLSFQLATLEENSVIFLWVVGEMSHPDLSGSESDLGLTPGSRIKLIKSSSVVLTSPLRDSSLRTVVKSFDLNLLPSNNSHFYVATDTGCVMHGVRYGGKAPPKAYRTEMEEVIEVTSIDFSPFSEPVFLAGYRDGSLRLFHVDCDQPLVTWTHSTEGRSVQLVKWCRSRPAVFFVLDDQSSFHIWDLRMDDSCPIHSESIAQTRVTSLCLSNDFNATGLGMSGHKPQMAVSLENGCIEVHTIKQQFSALMSEEIGHFSSFLQKNA